MKYQFSQCQKNECNKPTAGREVATSDWGEGVLRGGSLGRKRVVTSVGAAVVVVVVVGGVVVVGALETERV